MRRRMLHLALLVWALALTTASAQDAVVLAGQITDPHDNPVKRFHNLIGGCVFSFFFWLLFLRPKESPLCLAIRLN